MREKLGQNNPPKYFAVHPEQRNFTRGQIYDYQGKKGKEIVLSNPWIYSKIHIIGIIKTLVNPDTLRVGYARAFKLSPKEPTGRAIEADMGRFTNALIYFIKQEPLFFIICLILQVLLIFELIFAFVGLFSKPFILTYSSVFIISIVSYFLIISGGPDSPSRYRLPIMPMVCVMASYGLFLVTQKIRVKPN